MPLQNINANSFRSGALTQALRQCIDASPETACRRSLGKLQRRRYRAPQTSGIRRRQYGRRQQNITALYVDDLGACPWHEMTPSIRAGGRSSSLDALAAGRTTRSLWQNGVSQIAVGFPYICRFSGGTIPPALEGRSDCAPSSACF